MMMCHRPILKVARKDPVEGFPEDMAFHFSSIEAALFFLASPMTVFKADCISDGRLAVSSFDIRRTLNEI